MKQIKLTVPENWDDITIKQYQDFMKVLENEKENKEKELDIISIFCSVPKKLLKKFPLKYLNKVSDIIKGITDHDPSTIKMTRNLVFNGHKFGVIPNMSDMTTGEFVDLETYCNDSTSNLHKIIAVLYRRQLGDVDRFDRYKIEDYEPDIEKQELMKGFPMSSALGVLNFFFHLGEPLLKDFHNCLETSKLSKMKEHQLKEG